MILPPITHGEPEVLSHPQILLNASDDPGFARQPRRRATLGIGLAVATDPERTIRPACPAFTDSDGRGLLGNGAKTAGNAATNMG